MSFKFKNWKLLLLAFVLVGLFFKLGMWQLTRAKEKTALLHAFSLRMTHTPLTTNTLSDSGDWRFYPALLKGSFDNARTLLLDNKTFEGKIGYEVYTPFKAAGLSTPILIDRGFIPMGKSRRELPLINPILGEVTLKGMLNLPPTYVTLGSLHDPQITWPLRVEYINLHTLPALLGYSLYPYVVNIDPADPAAYAMKWQIVTMGPEKHQGYAVQWFALALTLLILSVALNCKSR